MRRFVRRDQQTEHWFHIPHAAEVQRACFAPERLVPVLTGLIEHLRAQHAVDPQAPWLVAWEALLAEWEREQTRLAHRETWAKTHGFMEVQ